MFQVKLPSQSHDNIASAARWTAPLIIIILMNMPKIIQALCSSDAFTQMVRYLHNPRPQTGQAACPPPSPPFLDLKMAADHNPPSWQDHDISWVKTMVTFCLTSVIEVALVSVQRGLHLPPLFLLFNLSIFFAFSSLFVDKYMNSKFLLISPALEWSGVFFTATAFVLATTIPFPLWLRCSTWAIYSISWSVILVSRDLQRIASGPNRSAISHPELHLRV